MIPVFKGINDDMSAPQDEHFFYPTSGPVHDRDGWGLHGLPYGIGPSHWYDFIEKPRYLILMAPEVSHCIAQGKCSFETATVIACYTNIIDAAKHMSSLTRNWTTPAAAKRARYVPDHHRHLIDIARSNMKATPPNYEAVATQAHHTCTNCECTCHVSIGENHDRHTPTATHRTHAPAHHRRNSLHRRQQMERRRHRPAGRRILRLDGRHTHRPSHRRP